MARENALTIAGNITRDPELRFTPGGQAVCDLGLAWNSRRQVNGEWVDEPNYFDCTVWGDMAENAAGTIKKGMRVVIMGSLKYESWENEQGEKRNKVKVTVDEIGPSLRWATASVNKVEKSSSNAPPVVAPVQETATAPKQDDFF